MVCSQLQRLGKMYFSFETLVLLGRGFFVLKKVSNKFGSSKNHIPNKTGNVPEPPIFPVLFVLHVGGQFWK
jgi:hypothetical protein